MSHRMHNFANMDIPQGECYNNRFQKRGKIDSIVNRLSRPVKRERSLSRSRTVPPFTPNASAPKAKINLRQSNDLKSESTAASVIHRELYTDNPALVEVTVKTHNAKPNSRSGSRSRSREPWSKLLKNQLSNEMLSSFHNFDPLRTVHFLAKELQSKLGDSNDRTLQTMIAEMQQALSRVPPEIASTVLLQSPRRLAAGKKPSNNDIRHVKSKSKENDEYTADDKFIVVKAPLKEASCQTIKNNQDAEKLQKHLEESSAKIETACKQMEAVCTRLKSEKEELEIMLRAERETVKFLRKQMEDYDSEKTELANNKIANLQQERDNLQAQVKKLKAQLESQQSINSLDLKPLVQDLRKQKAEADEQIAVLNHQLTLACMEKEKYVAILSARDRQIKEIRCEMTQLQEVVNEQLVELQNAPSSSIPSSLTNLTCEQPSWTENLKRNDISENLTPSSINTNESTLEQLFLKEKMPMSSFKELPSGDSSGTTVIGEVKKALKLRQESLKKTGKVNEKLSDNPVEISETHANIRDMFAEIKKQALLVTGPPQHQQKLHSADALFAEKTEKKK